MYVARQIEETPISIPQVLHQENLNFKDEKIGIVYPVYAGEAPQIVLEFLEKATFETDYFYLILTYGKDVTDAPECIARLLEEKGKHVNYIHSILMVDNYLPSNGMNLRYNLRFMSFYFYPFFIIVSHISFYVV